MYNFKDIKERLIKDAIILIPANDSEIQNLISTTTKKWLPDVYIEFLKVMGNGTPNGFLKGESCFFDEIYSLKKWSTELLEENEFKNNLTTQDFVFYMSQGYMFAFFNLNEGQDPPVYYYREGSNQKEFVKITSTLTEFFYRKLIKDKKLFEINS